MCYEWKDQKCAEKTLKIAKGALNDNPSVLQAERSTNYCEAARRVWNLKTTCVENTLLSSKKDLS